MGDLYDSIDQARIPADAPAVMGYIDGPKSQWSAEDWAARAGVPTVRATVLANPAGEVFDCEPGNASPDDVAEAMAVREGQGEWSLGYTNEAGLGALTNAIEAKSLRWKGAELWPEPGVYLFAADPTGAEHTDVKWAPVAPLAVQWQWEPDEGWDRSVTVGAFPAAEAAPVPVEPPAPSPKESTTVEMFWFTVGDVQYVTDYMTYRQVVSDEDEATLTNDAHLANSGVRTSFEGFGDPANETTARLSGKPWPVSAPTG